MACYRADLDPDVAAQELRAQRRCDYGGEPGRCALGLGQSHTPETWPAHNQLTDVYHAFNSAANRARISAALVQAGFAPGQGFSGDDVQLIMDQVYSQDAPYSPYDPLDSRRGQWATADGGRYVENKVDQLTRIVICRLVDKMALARWAHASYMRDISVTNRAVFEIDRPVEVQCKHRQVPGGAFLLPGGDPPGPMGGYPPGPEGYHEEDASGWRFYH